MHIFLIGGKARHGKDSLADIIMKKLNGKSVKIAMADYLKFIAKQYYGWDGAKDVEGRYLLQRLGTDKIRDQLGWDTFHVERVCQDIKIIEDTYDYVFIPDARFKNEMFYTQAKFPYNTTTLHVERLGFESPLTDEQQRHKSENDLEGFIYDYEIKSGDGLDKLEDQVDLVLGDFIKELNMKKFYNQYSSY